MAILNRITIGNYYYRYYKNVNAKVEKLVIILIIYTHFNLDYNITQDDIVINATSPFFTNAGLSVHQCNNNIGFCFPPLQISDFSNPLLLSCTYL